jgi:hypothetical protein
MSDMQCHRPSEQLWLKLEIRQNHLSIVKKICILYQIRDDVQTDSSWPRYGKDWRVTKKCQVGAALMIWAIRSSSESTYHCHLKWLLVWTAWACDMAPRSPDLTPMDFFLLGHIKALIYMLPVDSEEHLMARIIKAAATIRQQPGTFECTHQFWLCIEVGGCTL